MNVGQWMRRLGLIGGIAIIGAPTAALVTITVVGALALIGLIVILAFETICEGDRRRVLDRRHAPAKPDRTLRHGALPKARIVI